jgi:hypothetical protein
MMVMVALAFLLFLNSGLLPEKHSKDRTGRIALTHIPSR